VWSGIAGLVLCLGSGCGGTSGPSYTPVSATSEGTLYTIGMGDVRMVIDASYGARITEFSLDGSNVLTGTDVDPFNYGSTYWPSPQSSWCSAGGNCWPPIAALDSEPYTGSVDPTTNVVQLVSGTASIAQFPDSAVTVTKQFTPVPNSGAVDVTYTLTNVSTSVAVSVAPWQVSRVQATGSLTFFASPDGNVTYSSGSSATFTLTPESGDLWYDFAPVTGNSKGDADGEGWVAHVTPDRLLYLLAFPDIQPSEAAPGEAEVELYTGPESDYVEIETQGALTAVAPGATLAWTVRWKVRPVTLFTKVAVGSAGLVSLANSALAQ
jgi:hypothetical protein